MKKQNLSTTALLITLTFLLSLAGSTVLAATSAPMKPELAAKRENFRKQDSQRITQEKRTAAAEALKAERLRVYQAKQAAAQTSAPNPTVK